ncbi:MAG: FtsX-like permease family protein [Dehalococcoidia bacterium]
MEFGPILRSMFRNKVRFLVIAGEIALTLAVVVNCVHLIQNARAAMGRPSGFDDDHLLYVRSIPFHEDFKEESYLNNTIDEDLQLLRSLPGVASVAHSYFLPWQGGGSSTTRKELGSEGESYRLQSYPTYGDIVETLGIRVVEGRNLDETDYQEETQNILISKAYARLLFGDEAALGKLLVGGDPENPETVVGIIDSFYNPYPWPIDEYVKFEGGKSGDYEGGVDFLLRAEPGMVESLYTTIETELIKANPGRNVRVRTINEIKDNFFAGEQILMGSMGAVIFLLVFVTSLGIVGLTSFSVTQRTRQIGTRRALGAQKRDILRYFLLENWMVTTCGIAAGCLLGVGLNYVLGNFNNIPRMDLRLLVAGAFLLWATGLLSVLLPALRGSRISPSIATRNV